MPASLACGARPVGEEVAASKLGHDRRECGAERVGALRDEDVGTSKSPASSTKVKFQPEKRSPCPETGAIASAVPSTVNTQQILRNPIVDTPTDTRGSNPVPTRVVTP